MIIAIVGTGYVGLANSALLAQNNEVKLFEINQEKVDIINSDQSPIIDSEVQEYLSAGDIDLIAITDSRAAYEDTDYVMIATPTNYNSELDYFDTFSVDQIV